MSHNTSPTLRKIPTDIEALRNDLHVLIEDVEDLQNELQSTTETDLRHDIKFRIGDTQKVIKRIQEAIEKIHKDPAIHPYFKCPVSEYDSIEDFRHISTDIKKINLKNGKCINLYHRKLGYKTLTVSFSGAATRSKKTKPPFFSGLNVTNDIATDLLCIDDIALQYADDLTLGWYGGTHDVNLQGMLPNLIKLISDREGYEKIVFTGGSGGGFAAIYYASFFPESIAFVVNPQTDIAKYYHSSVERYLNTCFPQLKGLPQNEAFASSGITSCLPKHIVGKKINIAYVQNADDKHHVEQHMYPLMAAVGAETKKRSQYIGGIRFMFGEWGKGHAPLPFEKYAACLRKVIENNRTDVGSFL